MSIGRRERRLEGFVPSAGHAQDKDAVGCAGRWPQTLEAKGHRAGASRHHPRAPRAPQALSLPHTQQWTVQACHSSQCSQCDVGRLSVPVKFKTGRGESASLLALLECGKSQAAGVERLGLQPTHGTCPGPHTGGPCRVAAGHPLTRRCVLAVAGRRSGARPDPALSRARSAAEGPAPGPCLRPLGTYHSPRPRVRVLRVAASRALL
jgi:hypothetical protein